MTYTADHAGALADLQEAGAAVTFSRSTQSSYDPETDVEVAGAATTIAGQAIAARGDPERYRELGLVRQDTVTLLFAPTTYGGTPLPGDTVTWNSVSYTVRDSEPIAPDGSTIIARLICSK